MHTYTAGTYIAYYAEPIIQYHDVAVTNITSSRTIAHQGYTIVDIYVEVTNEGTFSETFSVTAHSNSTLLGNQTVTLAPKSNMILTFSWNTTEVSYGYYTLSANASRVPDEINLTNNSLTRGTVIVTIPGDVSGDGKVDNSDVSRVCTAYGSIPTSPNWNMDCDISGDLIVDGFDLSITGKNYGKSTH